jgi:hypothetical protein
MAEESAIDDEDVAEDEMGDLEETLAETQPKKNHGPGFRLGLIFGLLAGAAAATLFAPPTGEAERTPLTPDQPFAPPPEPGIEPSDRLRAVLERVRSRMEDASAEAHEASREAEEKLRTRYSELTEPPKA